MSREPDLALVGELFENIERNSLAYKAYLLLIQYYAIYRWHNGAKKEIYRVLQINSTVNKV